MKDITIKANAKINLFLEVTGLLPNGYHSISTVMHTVGLWDDVTVCITDKEGIVISGTSEKMPSDESNIAYRTVKAFFDETGLENPGVAIHIDKNIPMEAGLAGGSTDGAAALMGVNQLFGNPLSTTDLCKLGAKIGADIPFCMTKSSMLAEGIGDIMTPCYPLPNCIMLIVKPKFGVSTKGAYAAIDAIKNREIRENNMPALLEARNLNEIAKGLYNAFELIVPEIQPIKDVMINNGALGALMSGSGSGVFGIFDDMAAAKKARREFLSQGTLCHLREI